MTTNEHALVRNGWFNAPPNAPPLDDAKANRPRGVDGSDCDTSAPGLASMLPCRLPALPRLPLAREPRGEAGAEARPDTSDHRDPANGATRRKQSHHGGTHARHTHTRGARTRVRVAHAPALKLWETRDETRVERRELLREMARATAPSPGIGSKAALCFCAASVNAPAVRLTAVATSVHAASTLTED